MERVVKKADISEGINVNGENLTNLGFVDNVALFNGKNPKPKQKKTNGKTLLSLNSESLKVGLKYTRERQNT